jgi:flagellar basal body-associated protein FliL
MKSDSTKTEAQISGKIIGILVLIALVLFAILLSGTVFCPFCKKSTRKHANY